MSNPIDGDKYLSQPVDLDASSNSDKDQETGGVDEDLNMRVAEQAETAFNQMEEETRYLRTKNVEELDNALRERISSQEDSRGGFGGILMRIRQAVGNFWRRRERQESSQQVNVLLTETRLRRVRNIFSDEVTSSSQGRTRALFRRMFSRLLSRIRLSSTSKINLRGFPPDSPEGFLTLAMLARTICKVVSKDDGNTNAYWRKEEFVQALHNNEDLTIPSSARLEAIFFELDHMMQQSINSSASLMRGISLLAFLPKEQQTDFKQKVKYLANLDRYHDYAHLLHIAERMDTLMQSGDAEAQMVQNILYLFRVELSQFLGDSIVQCHDRFQENIDFHFLNILLEDLVPQIDTLFRNPQLGEEQVEYIQELVQQLYFDYAA